MASWKKRNDDGDPFYKSDLNCFLSCVYDSGTECSARIIF